MSISLAPARADIDSSTDRLDVVLSTKLSRRERDLVVAVATLAGETPSALVRTILVGGARTRLQDLARAATKTSETSG